MKKVLFLIFLSVFIVLNSFAQDEQNYVITGKIIDSLSSQPLEYSTVSLKNNSTQELSGTISDKNGDFKIVIPSGKYTLIIEFLSYNNVINPNFNVINNLNIGKIVLSPKPEALNTIQISGKTKNTSIRLGKTVYNVEEDIVAQGGTIIDILDSAPSVSVINGTPTIRGSVATVLVNGRISSMSKTEALENIQASSIKKIEVITTPSAKYRADSNGGIINIILKKGIDNGWNGSITSTAGIKNVYGGAASLNYRKSKFNFYSNTSFFQRERIGTARIENEYFSNGISQEYLTENQRNIRTANILNTLLGFDFDLTKNSSLNVEGSFSNFDGTIDRTNLYDYMDISNILTSSIQQFTYTDHLNDIYQISSTYNHYFDGNGKNLTLSFLHKTDKEFNDGEVFFQELFPNSGPLPDDDELFYDNLQFKKTNWAASYIFPTGDLSSLEIGTEGDIGQLLYDYKNEIKHNGEFITNPFNTDKLTYDEDIFSFYSVFEKENEKFYYNLGLRIEHTILGVDSSLTDFKSNRNYTDLFPSATFEYSVNENKSLSFYYGRGIQRATYDFLYPFEQQISETSSFRGNINLLPYYSNSIELGLLNSNSERKFTIRPTFYFRNYDNLWQFITIETGEIINEVPKLITTPVNLGYLNFTGIELITSYNPTEKINLTANLDGRHVHQSGTYEYTNSNNQTVILNYYNKSYAGSAKFKADLTIGNGYKFQTNYNYIFSSEGAYSKSFGYGYLNASFSKDLFGSAGSLTVAAMDIFNSNKTKRLRWTNNVNSLRDSQWREPSLIVTFTYRFNQSKKSNIIDINKKDEKEKI